MLSLAALTIWVSLITIFADLTQPVPTWTDKELLAAIGSTIAAAIPVCLFVIRLGTSHARRDAKRAVQEKYALQKRVRELEKKIDDLLRTKPVGKQEIDEMQEQLSQARQRLEELLKEKELMAARERGLTEQATEVRFRSGG